VGSSAFAPTSAAIADGYRADCGDAKFSSAMAGSLEGMRELPQSSADDRSRLLAFSDGGAVGDRAQLQRRPIAVVIYALVVNRSAGVQNLTAEQVKGINSGQVRNWAQLGGADLAIRIVGRGPDSGSRQAFEKYVLDGPEAPVSSNSCAAVDRPAASPVIRCERQTTGEVLDQVDRLPGAIGYADASPVARYGNVDRLRIANLEPTSEYLERGYGFWTIEYAYTYGIAPGGGLLDRYLGYLSSDAAARRLREAAYIPCVRSDRSIESLCQQNR
jgi:ABC-type phosphate transport system substrate-binding protein